MTSLDLIFGFSVAVFFSCSFLFRNSICKEMCVAVNSHACYIWIVSGITNCSTCLKKSKKNSILE